jgi:hypothetical protein
LEHSVGFEYRIGQTVNDFVALANRPIKTFTLRGIEDSPPYPSNPATAR